MTLVGSLALDFATAGNIERVTIDRTEAALEDQLNCRKNPEPGTAIRAMLKNGVIKDTGEGYDGSPIIVPTTELYVFGKRVTYFTGWASDAEKPFSRGPGTAPPVFIAVSLDARVSGIDYKEHEIRSPDGRLHGSHSSIEEGNVDLFKNSEKGGVTITCYSGDD